MRSLQERLDEFERRHVRVVAISVDTPEMSRDHARKQGFAFTFLSDRSAEVIRRYDLLHASGGPGGKDLSRPAEFLVDPGGVIRWVNLPGDYRIRATAEEILAVLDRHQGTRG